jgi:hypothetical protein
VDPTDAAQGCRIDRPRQAAAQRDHALPGVDGLVRAITSRPEHRNDERLAELQLDAVARRSGCQAAEALQRPLEAVGRLVE